MALDNLSGQRIQETYQKLVQAEGNSFATGDGTAIGIVTDNETGSFAHKTAISGAFAAASHSLQNRLITIESELNNTLISGSSQISTEISGAFTSVSESIATRFDGLTSDYRELTDIPVGIVSGSKQIATEISGAFSAASSSFSLRLATAETELRNTLISGSAQITTEISGAFTSVSESIASRLKTLEATEDHLHNGTVSGSIQIATEISGAFTAASHSLQSRITTTVTNITANSNNITANSNNITTLTNATSSYLLNTTDTLTGDLTVTGKITAEEFHTEFVTSSVIFASGSSRIGDSSNDTHEFTGSVFISGSGIQLNGVDVLTNNDTSSFITNSQTSSIESKLQSSLTVTLGSNFGGLVDGASFDAGSSIESILRQMLVQYQVPTLNSLSISGLASTLEVGETDTATGGTFATSSDSNGAPFASLALTAAGVTFNNLAFSGTSISFDSFTVRKTAAGSTTFFLNGTDAEGTSTTTSNDRTDSISWRHPIFFGGSSNDGTGLDDPVLADILSDISSSGTGTGLTVSQLSSNDDQTLLSTTSTTNFPNTLILTLPSSVANSNNFTYIVYPTTYGALSSVILNGVQIETGTFSLLGEASHSRHSNEVNYNVYRSAGKNAYSAGDTLTLDDA